MNLLKLFTFILFLSTTALYSMDDDITEEDDDQAQMYRCLIVIKRAE